MRILSAMLTAAIASSLCAQEPRLHPYLRDLVAKAGADDRLPVYFVMADRLGYEHFFPRVFSMRLAERRSFVVKELREHAARTQAELLDYLRAEEAAGNAAGIRSNWLGNFVQVEAAPLVILTGASIPGVEEVWYDSTPPIEEVQDAERVPAVGTGVPAPPPPAGVGPRAVRADAVWAMGFEGQGVLVANVDGGLTSHNDLNGRRWTNPGEIPGNGIDDDHNGYIDDVQGWSFSTNSANFDDGGGHGTSTAGAIAADGTCTGTAEGMAPQARIMTCQISSESSQWNAIQYAIQMGADLQTSSYSYKSRFNPPPNYKMHRDIGTASLAAGLIRTNSTSNDGSLCGSTSSASRRPFNISAPGCLPSPYLDPNQTLRGGLGGVIGVAAWDFTANALMSYSPCGPFAWYLPDLLVNVPSYPTGNWDPAHHDDYPWTGGSQQGLIKPDIASPTGTRTPSSGPCNYRTFSGTSNATPCAIGVIALWKSANPSLSPEDAAMLVHQTASDRGSVPGKENGWGAGVIDAEAGLRRALCVHRLDGQPQWSVEHSLAGPALSAAVDGVPSSAVAIIVGLDRLRVPYGPVTVGVGAAFATLALGATDSNGDFSVGVWLPPSALGVTLYTQAFLLDQTVTQAILDSNVVGLTVTP
ncbi:MAG: hypothetical protein Fur0037_05210 [Planctomycetota bacterium]